MAEPITLETRDDTPLLNPFVKHAETIFRKLMKSLGEGNAPELTVTTLEAMGPHPLEASQLEKDYGNQQTEIKQYLADWNTLDTKVAEIAKDSTGVTDEARAAILRLAGDINTAVRDVDAPVPPGNNWASQWAAVTKIDAAVGAAAKAVKDAQDKHDQNSGGVTDPSPVPYRAPSAGGGGGGGGGGYSPVSSGGNYAGGSPPKLSAPVAADVDAAIDKALDALHITDPAARAAWKEGYRVLIARESGGNINAINLTDSNASAGHPSQGLTQTIPGTFNAYHVPGTSTSITDPVANVAASMNYVMKRYGVSMDGHDLTAKVQQADASRAPKGY